MAGRVSKMSGTLKQLGQIQVNDWDFVGLLNTDIRELELRKHLKELGRVQVMEWDFKSVLPTIRETANQEIDVAGFFKRAAQIKVIEWDFRNSLTSDANSQPDAEIAALISRLREFLLYTAVNLIEEPNHALIDVAEIAPKVYRFKLVLVKRDVRLLVGREGHTATAIRNILKANASKHGIHVLLDIHSHEEEAVLVTKEETTPKAPRER